MEKTFNSMQTATQMLNSNQQMINRLELQVSQMAMQISKREKGTFSSQHVANPRSTPFRYAQVNTIHTLRSEKEIEYQVMISDQTILSCQGCSIFFRLK